MKEKIKKRKKHINKGKIVSIILVLISIIIYVIFKNNISDIGSDNIVETNIVTSKPKSISTITESSSFPTDVYGIRVYTELIEANTKARPGIKRKIKYIVIHETDNFESGVGAKNHAIFLKENNTSSTSWHYTVDDKEIYHHIPDNEVAYHTGDDIGNQYGIGIELCVNADGNFEKTFDNATKLVAYLLKEYNLTINDIKTHNDFSGKDCPHSILKKNRIGEFKRKVKEITKKS